jgi:HSP20 family protein
MNMLKKWKRDDGGTVSRVWPKGASRLREEVDTFLDRMRRDFERASWASLGEPGSWPPLDMVVGENEVTLRMDVPGLGPEDVDLQVSGNLLTIRGTRKEEWTERQGSIDRRERRFGSFSRTVTLPAHVDAAKVDATYDKGILTIRVPCAVGEHAKRIPVKSG